MRVEASRRSATPAQYPLIGLGGVGMMGVSLAQAMFKQPVSVADLSASARDAALKNGATTAYDPTKQTLPSAS
jgi:D-arabinose 1-dehydrogenase-like Zn-dependent alcohol dehydrogenase